MNQLNRNEISNRNLKNCSKRVIEFLSNNKNSNINDIKEGVQEDNSVVQTSVAVLLASGKISMNSNIEYTINHKSSMIGKAK